MIDISLVFQPTKYKISKLTIVSREVFAPSDFVCNSGRHLFDRFVYIKRGCIEFTLNNGQKAIFGEGSVIYLPYNVTYFSRWLMNGELIGVNFILTDEGGQMLHLDDNITLILSDTHSELTKYFEELWSVQITAVDDRFLLLTSLFYMFLYKIAQYLGNSHPTKEYGRIAEAIRYLEANYTADFDLTTLASICNLSCEMFRLYFRKVKGMSPMKYKTLLRLKKARELLSSKEYSVKEVSAIVGYEDVSYFSRIFKKEFGYPPVELIL